MIFCELFVSTSQNYPLNRLAHPFTANGIHKTPIRTGTVINKYGDHTYLPRI